MLLLLVNEAMMKATKYSPLTYSSDDVHISWPRLNCSVTGMRAVPFSATGTSYRGGGSSQKRKPRISPINLIYTTLLRNISLIVTTSIHPIISREKSRCSGTYEPKWSESRSATFLSTSSTQMEPRIRPNPTCPTFCCTTNQRLTHSLLELSRMLSKLRSQICSAIMVLEQLRALYEVRIHSYGPHILL